MFNFFIIFVTFANQLLVIDAIPWSVLSILPPNNLCTKQLQKLDQDFQSKAPWALKMLDAWAKPQAGLFFGNVIHMGNYDECLEVEDGMGLRGKYCSVLLLRNSKFLSNETDKILGIVLLDNDGITDRQIDAIDALKSYGVCVPKECSAAELQILVNALEETYKSPIHFRFDDKLCDDGDGLPFSTSAIIAIVIFAAFGVIIVSSSCYDLITKRKHNENGPSVFTAFSVITNGKKLLSVEAGEGNLKCLNGLRVLSLMWIVFFHSALYSSFLPNINLLDLYQRRNATENTLILAGAMAVDTFFTISGLLVVYLYMQNRAKGIKFNILMFYTHRILRLTPSLAMLLLFVTTLLTHIGNGPFWSLVYEIIQKSCMTNWWSTLIYLQNYIHTNEQCIGHAWYLAVDTQMYFLSPLILIPLVKWPKITIGAIVTFIALNCAYVFEISLKLGLSPAAVNLDNDPTYVTYVYYPTHVRGTVYLVGMLSGYFIFQIKSHPLKLTQFKVMALWIFSLSVIAAIVLGYKPFLNDTYTNVEAALFIAFTRISWSIAVFIIIFLCVNGYGGLVNSFLSHDVFTVLIRLNYNIYLVHLVTIAAVFAQRRNPGYIANMYRYHGFIGDYAFAVAASIVWTLSFESPILVLEKIIFRRNKK